MAGLPTPGALAFQSGLEGGINIGNQLFVQPERIAAADKRAQEEHEARIAEQKARTTQLTESTARANDADLLKLSTDQLGEITRQHQAVIQQYGSYDKVPQPIASKIGAQYRDWQTQHTQLLERARKRITGWVDDGKSTATDLQSGATDLSKVEPTKLANTIAATTGMNPGDFLDAPDGTPSKVKQAIAQITQAGQSGNMAAAIPGANILLAAELRQGVGTPGKDGTPITSKEIVGFVPVPNQGEGAPQGDMVFPVLRVKTQGHPDGYTAPVTRDRSSDPNDPPQPISLSKLMDRLQHYGTLAETLNAPGVRDKVQAGLDKSGQEIQSNLEAFAQLPMGKRKTKTETVDLGDVKRRETRYEDTGQLVGAENLEVGLNPNIEERLNTLERIGLGHDVARVKAAETAGGARVQAAGINQAGANSRAAAKTAAAGAKAQKLTVDQQNKIVADEARQYGIFRTKDGWREWKANDKGGGYYKELSPESNDKLAQIQGKVARSAAPAAPGAGGGVPTGGGGATPPVNLLQEGMKTTFKNGQVWTLQGGKPVQVQ